MTILDYVNDDDFISEINHLLEIAGQAKSASQDKFGKNVIDPFSAIFEISGFEMDHDSWYESETARQAQKTLQNHIGTFHQKLLGKVNGWEDLQTGSVVDLVNHEKKIIAEIKNKYNTISGGKLAELYYSLENLVMPKASIYKDYTAYYVTIIPKKPVREDEPFTPSDKEKGAKCAENSLIRKIDGSSFYHLVTGNENALQELYQSLPVAIESIKGNSYQLKDIEILNKYFSDAFG